MTTGCHRRTCNTTSSSVKRSACTSLLLFLLVSISSSFPSSVTSLQQHRRSNPNSNQQRSSKAEYSRVASTFPTTTRNRLKPHTMTSTSKNSSSNGTASVHPILLRLNKHTKWLVSFATLIGIFYQPSNFYGPYIGAGGILAVTLTDRVLKPIVFRQPRPEGAPFTDPGMPSTHALVVFYGAAAWRHVYPSLQIPFLVSAIAIAALRVLCGYHTIPQIAVGAVLGGCMGHGWTILGGIFHAHKARATFGWSWYAYAILSLVFLKQHVTQWVGKEKDL